MSRLWTALLLVFACTTLTAQQPLIERMLDASLADGFDFPVGNAEGSGGYVSMATRQKHAGWRVTESWIDALYLHAGEAWNGSGGGTTDAGQSVYSIAMGRVVDVVEANKGQSLRVEHRFLENGLLQTVSCEFRGIDVSGLKPGDVVKRRQNVGVIALGATGQLTQLEWLIHVNPQAPVFQTPTAFVRAHRRLFVPARDPGLVIAIKHEYRLYFCSKGKVQLTLPIALGQEPLGRKSAEGDNRTPEGEYRILQKALGPFDGKFGEYLGKAWIRLNYPNDADARDALAEQRITKAQCAQIRQANAAKHTPSAGTSLGGGIGIHGWVSDWPDGPQNLTWGCLSLRSADLMTLYSLVKKGTMVILHP